MCFCTISKQHKTVYKVVASNGDSIVDPQLHLPSNLPNHWDNPYLNTTLPNGILGFFYENKDSTVTVHTSVESRTFCILMKIEPIAN